MKLTNLDINSSVFGILKKCFMEFLNKIAPLKNYLNFVTKEVSKAIMMLRTKLRNQFLKKRTLEARTKYNWQRNICVSLVKNAKRNYYKNLDQGGLNRKEI